MTACVETPTKFGVSHSVPYIKHVYVPDHHMDEPCTADPADRTGYCTPKGLTIPAENLPASAEPVSDKPLTAESLQLLYDIREVVIHGVTDRFSHYGLVRHVETQLSLIEAKTKAAAYAKGQQQGRTAMQEADEKLSGMWSFDESHRKNLSHTYYVQASDILRAALSAASDEIGAEEKR
jgi:hypothetical protein